MGNRVDLMRMNQGDPIFGALGKLIVGGVKLAGRALGIGGPKSKTAMVLATKAVPAVGAVTAVARQVGGALAKSKTARVVGGLVATGGAAAIGTRLAVPGTGFAQEGGFLLSATGCPVAKVVEVSAHQRLMPIDRFGKARRRINVLNTKALSRATRRLVGFQKRARRVERSLARLAPKRRGRSKSSCKTRCD